MILLLYCFTLLIISLSFVRHLIYLFCLSFLYTKDNPTLEDHSYISIYNLLISIYPKNIQFILSEQKRPPPKLLSKLENNNITMNLNVASYSLNILASPDVSTWFTTGRPITKTIKHLGLTKNHRKTVERTWHMVNMCTEMELQYTGKNITKHFSQPYLFLNMDELNILADAIENHLGLRYTTHIMNCHRHHKGVNTVCKSTANLAFLRLQPKRTKIQRIQQGTKNEVKWKEARRLQTIQWLCRTLALNVRSYTDCINLHA